MMSMTQPTNRHERRALAKKQRKFDKPARARPRGSVCRMVAYTWETWQVLRSEEEDNSRPNYEAYYKKSHDIEKTREKGVTIERCYIDPEPYFKWCAEKGLLDKAKTANIRIKYITEEDDAVFLSPKNASFDSDDLKNDPYAVNMTFD